MKPNPSIIDPNKIIQLEGISNNCCEGIAIFIYATANTTNKAIPANLLKLGLPVSSSSALFNQRISWIKKLVKWFSTFLSIKII